MKKGILATVFLGSMLLGGTLHAADFATFGSGIGGGATYGPPSGGFGFSFTNPYGNADAPSARSQLAERIKPGTNGSLPTTQNNLGGTVLVVNATAPVNIRANLQNRGNVRIETPKEGD